jgi:hypothetical protein
MISRQYHRQTIRDVNTTDVFRVCASTLIVRRAPLILLMYNLNFLPLLP